MGSYGRLAGAALVLIRADALVPRELTPMLPGGARWIAGSPAAFQRPGRPAGAAGQRLAGALERLGPVGIKLGQFLSTRADIFGVEFAEDLSRLKDRLAPFPLPRPRPRSPPRSAGRWTSLFATFDEAVAGASLAQAHPARLNGGRQVAVKVLRPASSGGWRADVEALRTAARLAESLGAGRAPAGAPRLRRDGGPRAAAGAGPALRGRRRRRAARGDGPRRLHARAAVVWDGVAQRALTLEWAPGAAALRPAALAHAGLDRQGWPTT